MWVDIELDAEDDLRDALRILRRIDERVALLVTVQADIDNAVTVILGVAQNMQSVLTQLQADLAGKGVDTSKLDAALPVLQQAEQALQTLADSGGTPPTTSNPGTSTTGTTTTSATDPAQPGVNFQ